MTVDTIQFARASLRAFALLAVVCASGLPGAAARAEPIDRIVAIVDDDVIMQSEFNRFRTRIEQQLAARGGESLPQDVIDRQVLERLVMSKIQLQFARRAGVSVDDDTLNKAVASIAAQNKVSIDDFRNVLAKEGYDYAQFREDIRDEITIGRLKQREVDNRISVSEREIESFLQNPANQGSAGEEEFRLSHILIGTPEGASPEQIAAAQKKADALLAELRAGADFAKVAASSSDAREALDGGDLGWRKAGEMPGMLGEALRGMNAGDISEVMRGPNGFHIIKLADKRSSSGDSTVTQTKARHILIKTSEGVSSEEARAKLEKLKARLDGGDDFAELARSHSDDRGSAAAGGDLGWTNPGQMDPDFERAMDSLQPNQISEPFQTQFGWHIVQVLDRREHNDGTEAARAKARDAIRQRKTEEEYQAWMRRLRDEAYVEYRMPGVAVTAAKPADSDSEAAENGSESADAVSAPADTPAPGETTEPSTSEEPEFKTTTEDTGEDSPFVIGDPSLRP